MDIESHIGSGQTAEIYALDSQRVVKRFRDRVSQSVVEREVKNTRAAVNAGLPAPAVHELTSVNGNPAIIYERIRNKTMLSRLRSRPWTVRRNARRLAERQLEIHTARPSGLRPVRDRIKRNIQQASGFDPETREDIRSRLETLPQGDAFCHGDFHPQNVLLADEPIIIDWHDAGRGHPAADVARTSLLLRFAGEHRSRTLSAIRPLFRRWYLRFYCERSPVSKDQVCAWELPVAVTRLTEVARLAENSSEEAQLRSFIDSRLPNQ